MHTPYLSELQECLQGMVEVLAAGVWGGWEGVHKNNLCYYYYLMPFNCLSSSLSELGSQPGHCPLPLLVPPLLQIKDLVPPSRANHKDSCCWLPSGLLICMGEARGQTILALQQCFPTCASGKWGDSHMHDLFFWPLLHHTAASGAFLTPLKHFGGVFFKLVSLFFTEVFFTPLPSPLTCPNCLIPSLVLT